METEIIAEQSAPAVEPVEPARPVNNRFLFVDVAALRAKQLRRGARPRLDSIPAGSAPIPEHRPDAPHKPERVAMEEVRRGLVPYTLSQSNTESPEAEA